MSSGSILIFSVFLIVHFGLDIDGNPMYNLFRDLSMSCVIMNTPQIGELDWRNDIMKPIYRPKQYNAALGQLVGIVALDKCVTAAYGDVVLSILVLYFVYQVINYLCSRAHV